MKIIFLFSALYISVSVGEPPTDEADKPPIDGKAQSQVQRFFG